MKYVLDTNVLSELMAANQRVLAHLRRVSPRDVAIPQPALAEIAFGIERLPRSRRKDVLTESFDAIRAEIQVVVWSAKVTDAFATIKAHLERTGRPIEDFDIAIASHARAHDAVLVTANTKHMARIAGLDLEDWSS